MSVPDLCWKYHDCKLRDVNASIEFFGIATLATLHHRNGGNDSGCPRAGMDVVEKNIISCPCRDSNAGLSSSRPIYYNDYAIPAPSYN
jgi:hypothetical protein